MYIIGENLTKGGKQTLFKGGRLACDKWIWDNCDIGDLRLNACDKWTGFAYYEDSNGDLYIIAVANICI